MMSWLYFVVLFGYALGLMALLDRLRFGTALLLSQGALLLLAYWLCVPIGWLPGAAYVLMAGGFAMGVFGIVGFLKKPGKQLKRLCSVGFFLYIALCAYASITCPGTLIQAHDDLSFWAVSAKQMYTFDTFYINAFSSMSHTDYFPLLTSLQYAAARFFGWTDELIIYVPFTVCTVSFAAMVDLFPSPKKGTAMAVLLVIGFHVFGFGMGDLRADGPMCLFFTAVLCNILFSDARDWKDLLPMIAGAGALTGFKIYTGLLFALATVLACLTRFRHADKCSRRMWLTGTAAALVVVAVTYISWSICFSTLNAKALADAARLTAELTGQAYQPAETAVTLSGNPRTGEFLSTFSDRLPDVLPLMVETLSAFWHSHQKWCIAFAIAALALTFKGKDGKTCRSLLLWTVIACVIYTLGIFASYFVQEETFGAALTYTRTASTPLLLISLFILVWTSSRILWIPVCAGSLAALLLLSPPASWIPHGVPDTYDRAAQLGVSYYEEDISGLLTEGDRGKRALLLESSYAAAEEHSASGKIHAYRYFGLPVNVLEPIFYPYGDYSLLDEIDGDELVNILRNGRCTLLLTRLEDSLYNEELCNALDLDPNESEYAVYDILWDQGIPTFEQRFGNE